LQHFDEFVQFIQNFGIGMIILPQLISELKGTLNI
jgi:hypothetical protein